MSFDLLVFDLDGTLIDSAPDISASLQRVLERMGRRVVPTDQIVSAIGRGVRRLIERTADPPVKPVFEAFMKEYGEHLLDRTRLYPGVAETLAAIPAPKVVISNKPEAMSKKVLEGLGMSGHFRAIYGGDSFPFRKPDPEIFRAAAGDARNALMVGDSGTDLETARNVGVKMCAVTYGYCKPGELDGADYRIDRFEELLTLLGHPE